MVKRANLVSEIEFCPGVKKFVPDINMKKRKNVRVVWAKLLGRGLKKREEDIRRR